MHKALVGNLVSLFAPWRRRQGIQGRKATIRVGRQPSGTERRAGIQNGGVDRMSEMSSILTIALYRDASSPNEPK